ncbi:gasdermin-E [Clarias gariepinus]|uniref:gasdermin-E n=1 Tax=Clarias gariepinus TaxID=13013 RepID=UPI00234DF1C4|nr:gasdermin-E [Clarias gariepinus]
MFDKATRSLLHLTDQDGTLIAVSRLNDSVKLKPLAVVIKCPATWLWQRPKYKPTDFTLNDLLQGKAIQPELEKKVFVSKYEETHNGSVTGCGEVDMPGVSMKAKGEASSKILSSLGELHKESVIIPHFLKNSKERKLDLQHNLFTQIQGKNQVFTLLKERIFTTSNSTINFSQLKKGGFSAFIKLISPAKVQLNESISLKNSRDVAIVIPPHTVLAYSVSELHIKNDGRYEVGVSPDGMAADGIDQHPVHTCSEVDGSWALTHVTEGSSLTALNKELSRVKTTLHELTCLPPETRFSLLNLFKEILPDEELLCTLEEELERMNEESSDDSHTCLIETLDELVKKFKLLRSEVNSTDGLHADVFGTNGSFPDHNGGQSPTANWKPDLSIPNGSSVKSSSQRQALLTALHTLVTAAEELTNDGLVYLQTCSSETINTLHYLVTHLIGGSQGVPFCDLPFLLEDGEMPQDMAQMFSSSNITLKRDNNKLYAEIGSGSKVLPLVLCAVVHGLALLNESCEIDIEI